MVIAADAPQMAQDRYAALIEVARAVSGETDHLALLKLVSDRACSLIDAEKATLYLVDNERNQLCSAVLQSERLAEIRLPLGTGISGHVAKTGQPVNLEDAYADPRFDRSFDQRSGLRTQSMLTVPMHSRTHGVIGVLQIINKRSGCFDAADVALLEAFAAIAGIAVEAATLYGELDLMFNSFVETITATIDARDQQTSGHSRRVSIYAQVIAREMGLAEAEVELIRLAGLLHDVGKIGVPEAVLTKPGRLTDDERVAMQAHVIITGEVLKRMHLSGLNCALPRIAAEHHERPDGNGYPLGLKSDEISLGGRILGVADCFDALTHQRYYRNAMSYEEAYAYMLPLANAQFAPEPLSALGLAIDTPEFVELMEVEEPLAFLSSAPSAGGTSA